MSFPNTLYKRHLPSLWTHMTFYSAHRFQWKIIRHGAPALWILITLPKMHLDTTLHNNTYMSQHRTCMSFHLHCILVRHYLLFRAGFRKCMQNWFIYNMWTCLLFLLRFHILLGFLRTFLPFPFYCAAAALEAYMCFYVPQEIFEALSAYKSISFQI